MTVVFLLAMACARTEHTPVDVQVDVLSELPLDTERVRVCVSEGPLRSFGPGDGRYALPGLVSGEDPEVTVQALDGALTVLGQAGPSLVPAGYAALQWTEEGQLVRCEGQDIVAPEEEAWVLGVRFSS